MFLQETTLSAPLEYCFFKNIANPPNTNLTVRIVNIGNTTIICTLCLTQMEERLFMDYQALNDLSVPLRDVVNYEVRIKNDSNPNQRQKLIYAEGQLNISLRELGNMVCKLMYDLASYT